MITETLGNNFITKLLAGRPLPWTTEERDGTILVLDGKGKEAICCVSTEQAREIMESAAKRIGTWEVAKQVGLEFPAGMAFLPS